MINQKNIETIYEKVIIDDNFEYTELNDIIKLIMYDIECDENFLLSQKLFCKYDFVIFSKNSELIFQLIMSNKYNVIRYLMKNFEINLNNQDKKGNNILHYLSCNISIENFDILNKIDFISMSNHRNFEGKCPLHYAISNNNYDLIYKMIDVFTPLNIEELNNLIILSSKRFKIEHFKKITEKFIYFGLKINDIVLYNDKNKKNALSESLKYKNFEIAYFLLRNGAIFYSNMDVTTLIVENISDLKILKMLFNNGINVNKRNKYLDHPLIFLIINKFIDTKLKIKIISLFLEHGLNINTRDIFENNFLHYCILYKENNEIIEYIKSLNIIDNMNIDNINSVDLKDHEDLRNKYIYRINNLYK